MVGRSARIGGSLVLAAFLALILLSASFRPAEAWSGGDGGTYSAMDSNEANPLAPVYQWDDISGGTNTGIAGDDNGGWISLPFAFNFYGTAYTSAWACTNGFIKFNGASNAYWNTGIPGGVGCAIYGFWDDLWVSSGQLRTATLGTAPERRFVIAWLGVAHYGSGGPYTFEIILYEAGGANSIRIQHQSIGSNASPSIGITNPANTQGIGVGYGNGYAIGFWPTGTRPAWAPDPESTITTSGVLNASTYPGSILGTASITRGGPLSSVSLTIQRTSTFEYWNGSSWQAGLVWVDATGTTSWSYAFVPADQETYTLQSRAAAGTFFETTFGTSTFSYDLIEPDSAVTTSGDVSSLNYAGAIQGTASDPFGIQGVRLTILWQDTGQYWDGTAWGASAVWLAASGTGSWSYGFAPQSMQTYAVQSRAMDAAGNVESTYAMATFTYNLSYPDSAVMSFGFFRSATWNGVTGTAATTGAASIAQVVITLRRVSDGLYWDGGAWGDSPVWLPATGTTSWSYTFAPVDGETYDVNSCASDNYGNTEVSFGIGSFTYDTVAPAVTILANVYYIPSTWTGSILGTAQDAVSGVQTVEVSILRVTDGLYWNGADWTALSVWIPAAGLSNWATTFPADIGLDYTIQARATDAAGNLQTPIASSFPMLAEPGHTTGKMCSLSASGPRVGGFGWPALAVLAALISLGFRRLRGS